MMNIGIYCRFGKEEQRDDKRAVSEKILKESRDLLSPKYVSAKFTNSFTENTTSPTVLKEI